MAGAIIFGNGALYALMSDSPSGFESEKRVVQGFLRERPVIILGNHFITTSIQRRGVFNRGFYEE